MTDKAMVTDEEAQEWESFCSTIRAGAPGLAAASHDIPEPEDAVLRLLRDRERLLGLAERGFPEGPMNQDEQGGCVWCAKPLGKYGYGYATADPNDHEDDCPWVEARKLLHEAGREATP